MLHKISDKNVFATFNKKRKLDSSLKTDDSRFIKNTHLNVNDNNKIHNLDVVSLCNEKEGAVQQLGKNSNFSQSEYNQIDDNKGDYMSFKT
jgi:hypothetical protein